MAGNRQRTPLVTVALISAAALGYEILLMRLFSIVQWHHLAYMVISLALLGFGASGTLICIARSFFERNILAVLYGSAMLFAVTAPGMFLWVSSFEFNPDALLFDLTQFRLLAATYFLLALPFFFAANTIGVALMCFPQRIGVVYACDLVGAGVGSVGVILLLFVVFPVCALTVVGAIGFVAAGTAAVEIGCRRRTAAVMLAGILALSTGLLTPAVGTLPVSQYKGLSRTLRVPGTVVETERSGPLGLVTAVSSRVTPLRHAPGLSLAANVEPPEQVALFVDSDNPTVINRFSHGKGELSFLDYLTTALPYHLRRPAKVLVLGAGGGQDVLQALVNDARHVDAVEMNPDLVALVRDEFDEFSGHVYNDARVRVHVSEARGFVSRAPDRYDLAVISLLDAFGASSAGLFSLNETYLYTVEAIGRYLDVLNPRGMLAISRWVKNPPRDNIKLFATAVKAARLSGIPEVGRHIVQIRGWQTSTLLISRSPFSSAEIKLLRSFCAERWFDVVWYPGITPSEPNQFNQLREPYFFQAAQKLLSIDAEAFVSAYKFNIKPATDNAPYYFHFLRWRTVPEILALRGQGGLPLLEGGYLILIATLIQAIIAGAVLIVLPVFLVAKRSDTVRAIRGKLRVFLYFLFLGLGFIFVEIAFIQKLILFLSHPLYAVAVVLTAFLVFAGLGSAASRSLVARLGAGQIVLTATLTTALLSLFYYLVLDSALAWLHVASDFTRITVTVLAIAPLAFAMGLPFPVALARLSERARSLVPWAWAINGCASVVSAVLATVIAIHLGLNAVVIIAALLYVAAGHLLPDPKVVA